MNRAIRGGRHYGASLSGLTCLQQCASATNARTVRIRKRVRDDVDLRGEYKREQRLAAKLNLLHQQTERVRHTAMGSEVGAGRRGGDPAQAGKQG